MAERPQGSSTTRKRKRADSLEEHFMAVAVLSAQRSKDPNTIVGACIVNQEDKIVGIGYNDMPNGCEGLPWDRSTETEKLEFIKTKHAYVCHAELNAIMNKNNADVKGCTIYVTLFPCNECSKLIVQAGIKEVVYLSDKYHERQETKASRILLNKAGIKTRQLEPKKTKVVIDFNKPHDPPSPRATEGGEETGDGED